MEKQKSVLDTIHILYDNFFEQEKKSNILCDSFTA